MEKLISTIPLSVRAESHATGATKSRKVFYRPELDALRFIAFLSVFAHHSFPAPDGGGMADRVLHTVKEASALGVPLFFLLSSYLITELLMREKDRTGTIQIRHFYIRRVLRIWPLYFAILALAIFVGLVIPSQHVSASSVVAFLLLSGNWWPSSAILIANLWSISVEEQFYLIWPTAVRMTSKRGMMVIGILTWAASIAYLWWLTAYHATSGSRIWLNSLVQFQYFAIGIVLALCLHNRIPRLPVVVRVILILAGIGLMSQGEFFYQVLGSYRVMSPTAAMAIYVPAGIGVSAIFVGVLGWDMPEALKPLTYLGKISYGLYVFHLPLKEVVLYLAARAHITHNLLLAVWGIALPATVACAAVSYHFFERPFLKFKDRYTVVHSRDN